MIIYIIRHPQTEWHVQKRLQGHKDSSLTKKGKRTAEKLGKALKDKHITKIYSSDLGRCMQTSKIINKFLKVEMIPTPELRERDFGKLNGKPDKYVKEAIDLRDLDLIAPNGESFNQMKKRVLFFIKSISSKGSVLLVTHEGCVRAVLSDYYKINAFSKKCGSAEDFIGRFDVVG